MGSMLKVAIPPKILKIILVMGGLLSGLILIVLALQVAGGYMVRAMDGTSSDGLVIFVGAVLLGAVSGGAVSGFPKRGVRWVLWAAAVILATSAIFLLYSLWTQPQFSGLMAMLAWIRVLSWTILSLVPSTTLALLLVRWAGLPTDAD